jgi:5-formyltetrahydrofolate cyclo-ligase
MAIASRLLALPAFIASKSVLLYASFGSEVGTIDIIEHCLDKGIVVALPRVVREHDRLDIYKITDIADLVPGYRDIPEPMPLPDMQITIDDINIVVAPGVAFDEACNRIGYGKGYYDKLLGPAARPKKRQKPFFAALAYEEQIVPSIFCGPYDINMDVVITDKRTIYRHGS